MLIAIDPGQVGGGIAEWDPDAVEYDQEEIRCYKMLSESDFLDRLEFWATFRDAEVVMEKVGVMPNQGVVSSSKFMEHVGFMRGAIQAHGIRLVTVRPQEWMADLSLGKKGKRSSTEWKNHLKDVASQLYPDQKITLATSDALLILEWARRRKDA